MIVTSVEPTAHLFDGTRRGDSSADRLPGKIKTAPGGSDRHWRAGRSLRSRGLTPSLDYGKEGLAVNATHLGERWLPIPGYCGNYEASSLGRIRSVDRMERIGNSTRFRGGRILRPANLEGYLYVCLYSKGRRGSRTVHQLVAETFHGPRPQPDYDCCHNNGDSLDNRAENLRWDTKQENRLDIIRHGHVPLFVTLRDHCKYGHEFIEGSFRLDKRGWRICLKCASARRLIEREARTRGVSYAEAVKFLPMAAALRRLSVVEQEAQS